MTDPSKIIDSLLETRSKQVDVAELADELVRKFGGVKGIAKRIKASYVNLEPGIAKTKILTDILGLVKESAKLKQEVALKDRLTREQLVSLLNHLMINGPPEATPKTENEQAGQAAQAAKEPAPQLDRPGELGSQPSLPADARATGEAGDSVEGAGPVG